MIIKCNPVTISLTFTSTDIFYLTFSEDILIYDYSTSQTNISYTEFLCPYIFDTDTLALFGTNPECSLVNSQKIYVKMT